MGIGAEPSLLAAPQRAEPEWVRERERPRARSAALAHGGRWLARSL